MTKTKTKQPARPVAAETYQIGEWAGHPNYGCPYCPFATLDGTALVVAHIATVHRDQLSQAPKE